MTVDEAQEFVRENNRKLAGAFGFDVPEYSFRWDEEAEIILLDIQSCDGSHKKTYAVGFEDASEHLVWCRIHQSLSMFSELFPDWNKRGFIW